MALRFDDRTELQSDAPAGYSTTTHRRRPVVRWTDNTGAHAITLADRAVVGSAAGVDVLIAGDPSVSRLHAELALRDDGLWVRDLGSRNGTLVQGIRVVEACVPEGGTIRLGGTSLQVSYAPEDAVVDLWPTPEFGALVGASDVMRELFAQVARVAASDAAVMIQGETGTGKELVARSVHDASPRAPHPFVIVDCASLPESLLESELFGHAKGSFTGAQAARVGAIESAEGGTVFLDEIGELPLAMQPKLLRAIESHTVRRIGEVAHRRVDVRFVSATHRDLRAMVGAGAFREDLYFRLAVLPIVVPPLRAHAEDIPLLVRRFLPSGSRVEPPAALLEELATRPWLGNVRELRNFVERYVVLGAREAMALSGPPGAAGPPPPRGSMPPTAPAAPDDSAPGFPASYYALPFREMRDRWLDWGEKRYLVELLERHGGNANAVAQAANIDRSYVHRLMRKHGL